VKTRFIIPDSHGNHIDEAARDACLADMRVVGPDEIILLGDHLDCGGTFNSHQRTYTNEFAESYEADCAAANEFLDLIQKAAPKAEIHYLEGNHEQHVERWAARNFQSHRDADMFLERMGPAAALRLKDRGIHYYRRSVFYQGLAIPGCIQLGKCFFVHGISHAKHADAVHLQRFGASVVFGHIHRSMGRIERTVTSGGHGAWCPGTLAKLQPLYKHTAPSDWSHGYAVQEVLTSGQFHHTNVPIFGDRTIASIRRGAPEPVQSGGVYSVQVDPKRQARTVEAAVSQATRQAAREATKTAAILQAIKPKAGPSKGECVRALKKHKTQIASARAMGIHLSKFRRILGVGA
jgi:predicted phosphodiesterase